MAPEHPVVVEHQLTFAGRRLDPHERPRARNSWPVGGNAVLAALLESSSVLVHVLEAALSSR